MEINHHFPPEPQTMVLLRHILAEVTQLRREFNTWKAKSMASIQDLHDEVAAETTLVGGVTTLVRSLEQQLQDALSGASLPPAVQAQVDGVFAALKTNTGLLTQALVTNTDTPAAA